MPSAPLRTLRLSLAAALLLAAAPLRGQTAAPKRLADHFAGQIRSAGARAAYEQGLWALYNGAHAEAVRRFEAALRSDPSFLLAYARLATAHLGSGQRGLALAALNRAPGLGARAPLRVRLMLEAERARVHDQGPVRLRALEGIVRHNPRDAEVLALLGQAYQAAGRTKEAERVLLRAAAVHPPFWPALRAAARFYRLRRGFPVALRLMRRYAELAADEPAARELGWTYELAGNREAAREQYRLAMKRDSRSVRARVGLGRTFLAEGNVEAARLWADAALRVARLNDDRAAAYCLMGDVLRLKRDWNGVMLQSDGIRRSVSQAMEVSAYYRGLALVGRRRIREARDAARTMVSVIRSRGDRPRTWMPEAHDLNAEVLAESRELGQATEELKAALRLLSRKPSDEEGRNTPGFFYRRLGDVLHRRNRLSEAEAAYRKALRYDPRDGLAEYGLGLVAQKRRQPAQARTHFRRFLSLWQRAPRTLPEVRVAERGLR